MHVAKTALLRQAGFVDEDRWRRCIGELPSVGSPQVSLIQDSGTVRLTTGVSAGFVDLEDNEFFRVTAEDPGTTYAALFTVHTPEHCTPVGLHRLNEGGFGLRGWQSELLLMHEANGRRRVSAGGFVLVTEALDGTVRGALVRVPLRNALFNVTSTLTHAPFWVRGN